MSNAARIRMSGISLLCCLTFLLAGCSGGGGDSAKSGQLVDPSSTYTGTTTQAVVTATNAEGLAMSGFAGTMIASDIHGATAKASADSAAEGSAGGPTIFEITQILKQSVRRVDVPQKAAQRHTATPSTAPAAKVARSVTFQIPGDNGGTASYTLDVNDADGSFFGTINYQGFTSNGVTIDGTTDVLGTLDASRSRYTRFTLSFRSLSFRTSSSAFTLTGSLSWGFVYGTSITETLSMNMVLVSGAKTYWFRNYEVTTVYGPASLTQTIAGRYYDHNSGYVELTTGTPLVAVYNTSWPYQGTLTFSGNGSRWVRMSFRSTTMLFEADTTGDGTADWQTTEASNATPPINTPPVANAGPDQSVSQYSIVHLDGSASSDADGDPLTYTWSVVSGPAYPTLTGASTATPSFDATTQGTYVLSLTVYDGRSSSPADTVTITVTPVTASDPAYVAQQWQYGSYGTYIGQAGLYTADLDGDGTPEIIAGASISGFAGNSAWYVVRKNASGGYDQVWRSPLYGVTIARILLADMNGDGKDDVVVAMADGTVHIYDGPTLQEIRTLHIITSLSDIAVADLDGDGAREIAASNGSGVYVYDGQTGAVKWSVASGGGTSIAVGNVDADAAPEIVTTTYGGKGYVLNGQTGAVKWSYANSFGSKVRLADLDGDGMQEIVGASSWYKITIFDADLQSPAWEIATSQDIGAVTVVDADGDGIPEIVYGDGQWGKVHAVDVLTHSERWAVANPEHGVSGIALGDVDLDGKKELLWGAGGDFLYVADLLTGTIKWQDLDLYGLNTVAVGDVDNDGTDDIVMVSNSSFSSISGGIINVFNAVTHALKYQVALGEYDWMGNHRAVSIGDVDGDGSAEIVVSSSYTYDGFVSIYDGATGTLKRQSARYNGSFFSAVTTGDVDNDGKVEVVAGTGIATSEATGMYLIAFDGVTMQEKWRSVDLGGSSWGVYSIKVADLDKDGHPDIILTMTDKSLIVYDGVTHVQKKLITTPARALEVADVDGDGFPEVLVGRDKGYIDVYDGVTFAVKKVVFTYGTTSIDALRIADLKGDGNQEWLVASNGVLSILDAQGGLKWRSSSLGTNLGKNNSIAVKDVNGNGRQDIFIGSDPVLYQFE
ncbi:FG-GAP-like repeat-containing protein [Geobacter sp. AOG2]|uniref:FG-GAP-like repeat-containing protein n=1 Tax=Geobacter sp. AOG2 TaxID=1566347 RepID=UPI001CC44772|nr:FG-GAP-like repeat-containing protein [Geobacter sp. AOG2]GFE61942.1 hypothetical protein AOG2_25300 [Geobacter sp. AOG2]